MRKPSDLLSLNVERLQKKLKLSQAEVAAAAGITQPELSVYLSGKREPKINVLDGLSKALNCKPDDLLKPDLPPNMAELAANAYAETQERKVALIDAIEVLNAFQNAEPLPRAAAMYILTQNEAWLDGLSDEQKLKLSAID
jgi:transcriptional regulator with XRE-family HTH domain